MLFLGRGLSFPMALEGALKLKEISYVHAEGYAAGEMKHGPIALLDAHVPVVVLMPQDRHYDRVSSNMQEARAREAKIIGVTTVGDTKAQALCDRFVEVARHTRRSVRSSRSCRYSSTRTASRTTRAPMSTSHATSPRPSPWSEARGHENRPSHDWLSALRG